MTLVEQFEVFAMHPFQWETMVPSALLEGYRGRAVAYGYHQESGWFVLEKNADGTKSVVYTEKDVKHLTSVSGSPAREGFKFAVDPGTPPLEVAEDQMVLSRRGLTDLMGIAPALIDHLDKNGGEGELQHPRFIATVKMLKNTNLYQITSYRATGPTQA